MKVMLTINFIKKNKRFAFSQVPQLIILVFLLFFALIVGASNKDRLLTFASEISENDITGRIIISQNNQISAITQWENKLLDNNQTIIQVFQSGFVVPITRINSSLLLNTTSISSSIRLIFTDNIFNIPLDEAFIYGPIFNNNNISEGTKLNITSVYSYEDFYSSSLFVNITKEIYKVPNFIRDSYLWNSFANLIFLNRSALPDYMSPFPLAEIEFPISYSFSYLFTTEYKNSFDIEQKLNTFLLSSQEYLNSTFIDDDLEPVIIEWDTSSFLNRIENLLLIIKADLTFYGLSTLPLFLLLIIVIYQSKNLAFNYFKGMIIKLDEKGFSKQKINRLFIRIFFIFNCCLALIGLLLVVVLSFIFSFYSFRIIFLSLILLSVWITISIIFQVLAFSSELKRYYSTSLNPLEPLTQRKQWKYDLISFAFKGAIFSIICVVLYLLHLLYNFNQLTVILIYISCIVLALVLFHSSLESLLGHFISLFSNFLVVFIGKRIFKGTETILHKLYKGKRSIKRFEYTSLLILFILAPSVLIVSDSYKYHILNQQYALFCGDMVIENATYEVYSYLQENFSQEQLLPIIEQNTTEGVTFFFSYPDQYAEFTEHILEEGGPHIKTDRMYITSLNEISQNQSRILVSKKLNDTRTLSINDTLVFHPPSDEFITYPANITQVNYTISSVINFLPYISSKCDLWVFGTLELNQTETALDFLKKDIESGTSIIFNQSFISTVSIKLNGTESPDQIKTELSSLFPFLNILFLGDKEVINQQYPVPFERFQQMIILELIIAFLLLQLFYLQLINSIYHQRELSILQLFTKGIPKRHLFLGFSLSLTANIFVISILSIPFMFLLSLGILKLITTTGITNAVTVVFSYQSISIFVSFMLLTILLDVFFVYRKLHTTLKNIEKYLGEINE